MALSDGVDFGVRVYQKDIFRGVQSSGTHTLCLI